MQCVGPHQPGKVSYTLYFVLALFRTHFMKKLTYHEPHPISREEAESAFASGDSKEIAHALVNAAFHDADWRWVQEKCLNLARSEMAAVRQIAVTCLGHVACIHRKLDLDRVLPVLDELSRDPEVIIEDALDDILMFMKVDARRK
jgi:hypothetical protein